MILFDISDNQVILIDTQQQAYLEFFKSISTHFRGEDKSKVITISDYNTSFRIDNIFNSCIGLQYKFSTTLNPNWNLVPYISYTSLVSTINTTTVPFQIRVETQDYDLGSECGFCLSYKSLTPTTNVLYTFNGISQDVVVYFKDKFNLVSATSNNGATFTYNLITNNNQSQFIQANLTLAQLNTAINALPVLTEYAVLIYASYSGSNTSTNGTFVFNRL